MLAHSASILGKAEYSATGRGSKAGIELRISTVHVGNMIASDK